MEMGKRDRIEGAEGGDEAGFKGRVDEKTKGSGCSGEGAEENREVGADAEAGFGADVGGKEAE